MSDIEAWDRYATVDEENEAWRELRLARGRLEALEKPLESRPLT